MDNKISGNSIVKVGDVSIGGGNLVFMAGPCAVESKEQVEEISKLVKEAGADIFRAGAYKARTSPFSFQGLGKEGLKILKEVKMPTISEITALEQIPDFVDSVDIIQVGARNMQNFELLKALGKVNKPILLKRGFSATAEEWLCAAQYILSNGNKNVILCERGIRTFDTETRFTLDLGLVSYVKKVSNLPIIVDPSHAAGKAALVKDLSLAAIAAGADGLLIEVAKDPCCALSDGYQAITPDVLKTIIEKSKQIKKILD